MDAKELVLLIAVIEQQTKNECSYVDNGVQYLYMEVANRKFEEWWDSLSSTEQMGQILLRRSEHMVEIAHKLLRDYMMDKRGSGAIK